MPQSFCLFIRPADCFPLSHILNFFRQCQLYKVLNALCCLLIGTHASVFFQYINVVVSHFLGHQSVSKWYLLCMYWLLPLEYIVQVNVIFSSATDLTAVHSFKCLSIALIVVIAVLCLFWLIFKVLIFYWRCASDLLKYHSALQAIWYMQNISGKAADGLAQSAHRTAVLGHCRVDHWTDCVNLCRTDSMGIGVASNLSWGSTVEALRAEIQGQRPRAGEEFLGRGQQVLSPPARGPGGALCIGALRECIFGLTESPKTHLVVFLTYQSWTLEGWGLSPSLPPGYTCVHGLVFFSIQ